jgi:ribosomal protein S18 acetylase RimI-like enzyme
MKAVIHAVARKAGLRVFRFFSRRGNAAAVEVPGPIRVGAMSEAQLGALCTDPAFDLTPAKLDVARERGDVCVGAFDGDRVAAYSWIAFAPLHHLDGVWVEFSPQSAWIYKSLVLPAYRGRRIAGMIYRAAEVIGMEKGRPQSLLCVESHNTASIRATRSAGYRDAGYAAYVRRGARLASWVSPAARDHGVRFFVPASGNVPHGTNNKTTPVGHSLRSLG